MTNRHALLSACVLAIAVALFPTIANAYEYEVTGENYALGAVVTEDLPPELQSDTLAAVNDGIAYPERPHNTGGPNPYAWTNFNAVQSRQMYGGGFTLDFGRVAVIDRVVVNYFVDSYSADLPESVTLYWIDNGEIVYPPYEQVLMQQISPTCFQAVYRFTGNSYERTTDTLSFFALEQWGPGEKVVHRCVGVYEIEVYGGPDYWSMAHEPIESPSLARIDGSAPAAAARVSQLRTAADTVVIVNEGGWRDATSAMALAGKYGAPLLYTSRGALSAETRAEVERLGASNAIIVGGTGVVSENVANTLRGMGLSVSRVWGNTAQDTSRAAAAAVGASDVVIVTTADYYGDALSIAPWAYANAAPIILAENDGTLAWESIETIRALGAREALVLSGNNALSNSVSNSLVKAAGLDAVTRLNGANSVDISAKVVEWELERGFSLNYVGIVGRNAEAAGFAGAAYMGSIGCPTIFVNGGNISSAESVLSERAGSAFRGWVFGGDAIPENSRTRIEALL